MDKFSKVLTISTSCNIVSLLVKRFIYEGMNLQNTLAEVKNSENLPRLGATIGTSYLVSTIPALVGYGVGSMVDNSIAKQALSVIPAVALTAGAECFTTGDGFIQFIKPTVDNFKIWNNKGQIDFADLKKPSNLHNIKCEMVDFVNTFIQTELFNIFLPDAVDSTEILTIEFDAIEVA